jgi:hypothetical protein
MKPTSVVCYNNKKFEVDLSDQLEGTYLFALTSRKYWKKMAFYILNAMVTNAYILQTRWLRSRTTRSSPLGRKFQRVWTVSCFTVLPRNCEALREAYEEKGSLRGPAPGRFDYQHGQENVTVDAGRHRTGHLQMSL